LTSPITINLHVSYMPSCSVPKMSFLLPLFKSSATLAIFLEVCSFHLSRLLCIFTCVLLKYTRACLGYGWMSLTLGEYHQIHNQISCKVEMIRKINSQTNLVEKHPSMINSNFKKLFIYSKLRMIGGVQNWLKADLHSGFEKSKQLINKS